MLACYIMLPYLVGCYCSMSVRHLYRFQVLFSDMFVPTLHGTFTFKEDIRLANRNRLNVSPQKYFFFFFFLTSKPQSKPHFERYYNFQQ